MKKVLILSFSPTITDPRVMRQIEALVDDYALSVVGFGEGPKVPLNFFNVVVAQSSFVAKAIKAILLFLGLFELYYWRIPAVIRAVHSLDGEKFDIVIANDVNTLPLAFKIADGHPVFFDAHEYSPKEFEDNLFWRIFFFRFYDYLCRVYLPKVSLMTTVCEGIATEYHKNYGVKAAVLFNSPSEQALDVTDSDGKKIRLIHHGAAIRSRKLELMIELMSHLGSRFTLDLMLVNNNQKYLNELKQLAGGDERINFIEPVALQDICGKINNYDIGLFLLPPVNFNYKFALPNKFFEFIQARLAVAIGPSPEMTKIVNRYGFGVVSEDFSPKSLADRLSGLTFEEIQLMKKNADTAAKKINSNTSKQFLLDEVNRLIVQSSQK